MLAANNMIFDMEDQRERYQIHDQKQKYETPAIGCYSIS